MLGCCAKGMLAKVELLQLAIFGAFKHMLYSCLFSGLHRSLYTNHTKDTGISVCLACAIMSVWKTL